MCYKCKECEKTFENERSLHAHFKAHEMSIADYYVTHYPRFNKLNGNPLPFKNKEEYFENDFVSRSQLIEWCFNAPEKMVKDYIIEIAKRRIKEKKYTHAPFHIELKERQLPDIDIYIDHFGTYQNACAEMGVKSIFYKGLTPLFFEKFSAEIATDTREQKPLNFENSQIIKLDFGDYTAMGENFTNTFVDRKSSDDFIGTFGAGFERFKREMERCKELDSYMYIVVEKDLAEIKKEVFIKAKKGHGSGKFNWIISNLIALQHEFYGNCQFIFTKNRSQSEKIIPKLLCLGEKLWHTDMQYFIDTKNILEDL
jgi:hypothetical protein